MGLLVNGAWQEDISRTKEGRFIRPSSVFRNQWIQSSMMTHTASDEKRL